MRKRYNQSDYQIWNPTYTRMSLLSVTGCLMSTWIRFVWGSDLCKDQICAAFPISPPDPGPRCATVRLCAKASTLSHGMGMFLAQPLLEHLMVGGWVAYGSVAPAPMPLFAP